MPHFERIICVVLDGVGVGEAPDADRYGDSGSHSLGNTARHVGGVRLPTLESLGLGNVADIAGVSPRARPAAGFGRMRPAAAGKDSTSGHWELMGCVLEAPLPTYPDGFPGAVIAAFEQAIGRPVLGNTAASGTSIIEEFGAEHMRTGHPILYTSQDSVFQIAAHEAVIPVDTLYAYCETARALLIEPYNVGRVIARPFTGVPGGFYRTSGRKDFSLSPVRSTLLDGLSEVGKPVLAIGKIAELFAGCGVEKAVSTRDNREGMEAMLEAAMDPAWPFVFTNLVDFDTMWGHRNDPRAYALGLEEFDTYLGTFLEALDLDTLLIITSDHGNDPTTPGTDHSREWVPLLAYAKRLIHGKDLGERRTLADVAATVAENFQVSGEFSGTSFLGDLALQASNRTGA